MFCLVFGTKKCSMVNHCELSVIAPSLVREISAISKVQCKFSLQGNFNHWARKIHFEIKQFYKYKTGLFNGWFFSIITNVKLPICKTYLYLCVQKILKVP